LSVVQKGKPEYFNPLRDKSIEDRWEAWLLGRISWSSWLVWFSAEVALNQAVKSFAC